ncbi:MAG TPA: hypothetical protein VL501_07045 [Pyrinomonadaceae bacterium]|nr:hypothetical protein [Pyrinomonadaceae bacterium]
MQVPGKPFDAARIWPYFAGLLLLVLPAFWPTYFAPGLGASSTYAHFHAAMATLWMCLLIAQPLLLTRYRFELHRLLGKVSFIIAPALVLSIVLLANYRIRAVTEDAYPVQTYFLYLQFSLALLFALCYTLAMIYRRRTEIHAAFMICTGLTLIDPVFARIIAATSPALDVYEQWWTFGLTDLLLVVLIVVTWRNRGAARVFTAMLPVFVLFQLPALLKLTEGPFWQAVATYYRSIPIT